MTQWVNRVPRNRSVLSTCHINCSYWFLEQEPFPSL